MFGYKFYLIFANINLKLIYTQEDEGKLYNKTSLVYLNFLDKQVIILFVFIY